MEVSLRSAGDPWDKSGTLFAFADAAGRDYLTRMQEGGDADTTRFAGILSNPTETNREAAREPALELLRFITPFGVGHFSHTERAQAYKPESVGAWADSVHGPRTSPTCNRGSPMPTPCGSALYIDTWTDEGYTVSARITMDESDLPCDAALTQRHRPLLNTTKLAHDQRPYTAFPDGPLTRAFTLDAPASGATLDFLTTGHGGHAGGDEFTEQEHIPPRRRHPEGLDALAHRLRRLPPVEPDQRLLALHLRLRRRHPRGARGLVRPQPLQLVPGRRRRSRSASRSATLAAGEHTLEIAIPGAQPWTDSTFNFWNIAAWIEANCTTHAA